MLLFVAQELSLSTNKTISEGKPKMVELRTQEQQLLKAINDRCQNATVEQLVEDCKVPDAAVMRTALTLQEKNLITISAKYQNIIRLTLEGVKYGKDGLPERCLIKAVESLGGMANLKEVIAKAGIQLQFSQIALGWAIRKKWATYNSIENILRLSETFSKGAAPEGSDEVLLKQLNGKDHLIQEELTSDLRVAAEQLKKRTIITIEPKTSRTLKITEEGKKAVAEAKTATQEITQLTPDLIITGKWHTAKLRKYNIQAPVAKAWPGKKHPYLQFLDEVREKLVQLGFEEMTGTAVETSFFNFDALYVPQDHPARDESDIYYVKAPQYGDLGRTR